MWCLLRVTSNPANAVLVASLPLASEGHPISVDLALTPAATYDFSCWSNSVSMESVSPAICLVPISASNVTSRRVLRTLLIGNVAKSTTFLIGSPSLSFASTLLQSRQYTRHCIPLQSNKSSLEVKRIGQDRRTAFPKCYDWKIKTGRACEWE